VGEHYFLANSSFTLFPGVPIFRSSNLIDWLQVGNALDRESQLDLSSTIDWVSLGVFAPTLRHHDGKFWLITTAFGTSAPTFLVTSQDPAGPWSEPVPVELPGIDPDLAWDVQGNCWVHFSGPAGIERCRIDDITGEILEGPDSTWSGTGLQYPEAPHLFTHDGLWYLLIAEGGTERGHAVSVARGPTPVGPWESCPFNPILSHRSTDRPIQNTGHADPVCAPDGSWWMVLLGVRPRGVTPGFHVLGRETFLTSIEWVEGWPVPREVDLDITLLPPGPPETVGPPARDDFDEPSLGPQWVSVRRSPSTISSLLERRGWLTLHGTDATLVSPEPVLVARRQQHHLCRVRTLVDADVGVEAGLTMWIDHTAHYEIAVDGKRVVAFAHIGPLRSAVGEAPRAPGPVILTIETVPDGHGPDVICLGLEDHAGNSQVVAEIDGRYLSTEVAGGFFGRIVGMYTVGGAASFDWFEYKALT
jgi:xylan 1,4-beta-xylosidase